MNTNSTRGRASAVVGAVLIGVGALFLISRLFNVNLGQFVWPFFVILPGAMFFVGMVAGGKAAGPLAVPGSIITMTGLILLYDSLFNAWANWAYIWALIFPTAVGIGLIIHGTWSDLPTVVKRGTNWTAAGLVILLGMGLLFEMLIYPLFNVDRGALNTILWPALLIGLGFWLMRRRKSTTPALPASVDTPVQKSGNGHRKEKQSPVVGFEPIDPTRGKN